MTESTLRVPYECPAMCMPLTPQVQRQRLFCGSRALRNNHALHDCVTTALDAQGHAKLAVVVKVRP